MRAAWQLTTCHSYNAFAPGKALLQLYASSILPKRWTRSTASEASRPDAVDGNSTLHPPSHIIGLPSAHKLVPPSPPPSHESIPDDKDSKLDHFNLDLFKSGTIRKGDYPSWHVASDSKDYNNRRRKLLFLIGKHSLRVRKKVAVHKPAPRWLYALRSPEEIYKETSGEKWEIAREYQGRAISPGQSAWQLRIDEKDDPASFGHPRGSASDRLKIEIDDFVQYMKADQHEQRCQEMVIKDVQDVAAATLPNNALEVFGSRRTGLDTAIADIDFRLCPSSHEAAPDTIPQKAPRQASRKKMVAKLSTLYRAFENSPKFIMVMLRRSRYPLINMQHKDSGVSVQVVCSNDTNVQRELVQTYLSSWPALRGVFLLVKSMFDIRGLNDVYRGGLGSYSIFMMIVAAITHAERQCGIVHHSDSSNIFMHFLNFWDGFDTYRYGVMIKPPATFRKPELAGSENARNASAYPTPLDPTGSSGSNGLGESSIALPHGNTSGASKNAHGAWIPGSTTPKGKVLGALDPYEPYMLSLIDPADEGNDLGRKAYGIKHIIATIDEVHLKLQMHMWDWDLYQAAGDRTHRQELSAALEQRVIDGTLTPLDHYVKPPQPFKWSEKSTTFRRRLLKMHEPLLGIVIGNCHAVYETRRAKMREYGRGKDPG